MSADEQRINDLEREVRELNRTLVGVQNMLRSASRWSHDDPEKLVEGIQVFLGRAAEYQPRSQRKGRR